LTYRRLSRLRPEASLSIIKEAGAVVAKPGQQISLSSLFDITAGGNPQYVIVSLLDRDEYTATSNGNEGTLSGDGATASFASIGGDANAIGLVFTYNAATGQYTNAKYGNLANLTYTASTNPDDQTSLSLFATSNLALANEYATNPFVLSTNPTYFSYAGSVSIVTSATFGAAPVQATPDSVCTVADSFVDQAWNMDGCWVLASDIAAEAGASLPLTSTSLFVPGEANGEWIVAYDGPAGQTGNWEAMVHAGEIVAFATSSDSGHITTVVSGSGSTAELVDNITYVNANGSIANSAHDGSADDIVVAAPHAASQEFAQAVAGSVVIYELDTPIVTDTASAVTLAATASDALSSLFTVSDPAARAITEYQFYDTTSSGAAVADSFSVGGAVESGSSAAGAITVSAAALSSADFLAGASTASDALDVRAFNGLYWGDWQTLGVTVAAPKPPVVSAQTPAQSWLDGETVRLALPADTFSDPQNEKLTYAATQSNGAALPSWLAFNAATDTFSGTVPAGASGSLGLKVTATDTGGLSVADTFTATFLAPAATDGGVASLESQLQNLATAMASYGVGLPGFGPTALTQTASEASLQLAAAAHH
jgi:hypothetical protein